MEFTDELARIRNAWRRGLAVGALMDLAAIAMVSIAAICWLDLLIAMGSGWRLGISAATAVALAAVLALRVIRLARLDNRAAAIHADKLLASRRREVLSAFELARLEAASTPAMILYCIGTCVAAATARLRSIEDPRPHAAIRAARKRLFIAAAIVFLPALLNPLAALTLAGRLFVPLADIPPWSPYRFAVDPERPQIIYGGDATINVAISGAPIRKSVTFATRQGDRTQEVDCYHGGTAHFAQRIERVTQPIDFCFRVGRARSRWHRVEVLLQPVVESAEVRLTPPAYSRRPERTFALGAEPLSGLRGSKVEMLVRSNRPLGSGTMTLAPTDGISAARTIEGEGRGLSGTTFSWTLDFSALVKVQIRDIQGTPAREPMRISQDVIPDAPPKVSIEEPAPFSLATPSVTVPISGYAEDDLSLRRVELLRGLVGYRQRGMEIDGAPGASACTVTGALNLAPLGIEPGQVIEILIEAMDSNPDLTGIGASGIARVEIISDEAYADIVRKQTTLAEFSARFAELAESVDALARELAAAQQALAGETAAAEKAAARIPALRERVRETAKHMRQLASDFAAFDLEERLSETANDIAFGLEKTLGHPGWEAADRAAMAKAIEESLGALGRKQAEVKELSEDASSVAAVGRLMACAARYRALLDRQELLTGRLDRFAAGEKQVIDPVQLAKTQDAIREELSALGGEIEAAARDLPDGYEDLRDSAREFSGALRELKIPKPMSSCALACRNGRSREARDEGLRALELMRQLISNCDMGGLCKGGIAFVVPADLSATMAQMLEALMQRYGSGTGSGLAGGAGLGLAGFGDGGRLDGYSMPDVPVYGPPRRSLANTFAGRERGDGRAGGGGMAQKANVNERVRSQEKEPVKGRGAIIEAVPARYRDAVKAFYGREKP